MVASKLNQILQLNPSSEIIFQGPFDTVVTSHLELKNPSDHKVCFKVKTTAPKRYCVRPNSGIIDPEGHVRIAIMLQPMDPNEYSEWNKHKFMVQSTVVDEMGFVRMDEVWDSAKPEEIMDSKLRCVFNLPSLKDASAPKEDNSIEASEQQTKHVLAKKATADTASTASETTTATIATGTTTTTPSQQAARYQQERPQIHGDGTVSSKSEPITTSTPAPSSRVTSSSKAWGSGDQNAKRSDILEQQRGDKSMASSSHNLTSSFLQPMNDDYKIVLVSLAMLFLGVILGKYII